MPNQKSRTLGIPAAPGAMAASTVNTVNTARTNDPPAILGLWAVVGRTEDSGRWRLADLSLAVNSRYPFIYKIYYFRNLVL